MRTVSQEATNAITLTSSTKSTARLTVYKSRNYFDTYTDKSPLFAFPEDFDGRVTAEAVAYVSSIDKVLTIAVNEDDELCFLVEGSETPVVLTYDSDYGNSIYINQDSRPGIFGNKIFYYVDSDYSPGWYISTFDASLVDAADGDCLSNTTLFSTLLDGAIYPVTTDSAIILTIDQGGIRPTFIASDGSEHECPGRFMNPTYSMDSTLTQDILMTHFAGAILKDGTIYLYVTIYSGAVHVTKYKLATNSIDGSWSDFLIAVPEDLSTFQVGNVFVANDRIFLCGRFYRNGDLSSGEKYTLLLWSYDGITFSLDRRTLVTTIVLRFLAVVHGDYIQFISTNRYYEELSSYQIAGENAPSTVVTLNSISGSTSNGWNLNAKSSNEAYLDDTNMVVGSYAKLDIGLYTSSGIEWIKYHDVVISSINKGFEDGSRTYQISIMPDGRWHTASMTHPFYMEIQSKQSHFDPMADLHNMVVESMGNGNLWALSCDFWADDNANGLAHFTHAGSTTTLHWGKDLIELCDSYPVLPDDEYIEFRIYAWSRAGIPSVNPNVADSTPTSTLNDDFYALMLIEDDSGNQSTVSSLIGELSSTYSNPPQTHFPEAERAGSTPIIYQMANPGAGKKIIKLGVKVISDTGNTTYYTTRVELPDVTAIYTPVALETPTFEVFDEASENEGLFFVDGFRHNTGWYNYVTDSIEESKMMNFGLITSYLIHTADDGQTRDFRIIAKNWLIVQSGWWGGENSNCQTVSVKVTVGAGTPVEVQQDVEWLTTETCPPLRDSAVINQVFTVPPDTIVNIEYSYFQTYPAMSTFLAELSIAEEV